MVITPSGGDDVERLLAALKTLFDERQQQAIFLVNTVKESTDVTVCAKLCAGEADGEFV
jgi:hypothetical protein